MNRPIIIVDPYSSGSELAPAFNKKNIPCIAVLTSTTVKTSAAGSCGVGYGAGICTDDFLKVIPQQPDLIELLRSLNPLAIIAGSEGGVQLADQLANLLTPNFANVIELSSARRNKLKMQQALAAAGLPIIPTISSACVIEIQEWLQEQKLTQAALIVKPPESSGSDNVYHIPPGGNWIDPFNHILSVTNNLLKKKNESVIVQEQVKGIEFGIDTVSSNGHHVLSHLNRYTKASSGERETIFDHTEFLAYSSDLHGEMWAFVQKVLDALGIRWGAAHSEIMLTANGPRLIETGARMCGGPVLSFARAATGSSQLERVLEAYIDGKIQSDTYNFKQTVVPIFLSSPTQGILKNIEILDSLQNLPTHLKTSLWVKNESYVRRTVDYVSSIGIIALAGDRDAIFRDYQKVREIETQLVFV